MYGGSMLGSMLLFLLIVFVVFLVCRELNCWYFKINERRELLAGIKALLEEQNGLLRAIAAGGGATVPAVTAAVGTLAGSTQAALAGVMAPAEEEAPPLKRDMTDDEKRRFEEAMKALNGGADEEVWKARETLGTLAKDGCTEAQYELAGLCMQGVGGPQDIKRAAEMYEKAALVGYKDAKQQGEWARRRVH